VQKARDNSMPLDNIERAIKRGSGRIEGAALVEMVLEGYGPSGVAILVQALSDNRNRTLQDVRNIFSRHGGNLSESGSVAWLFDSQGLITVPVNTGDAEEMALEAIDTGADDVKIENKYLEVYTKPTELEKVREALEQKKMTIGSAEVCLVPKSMVELEEKAALQTLKLLDRLEELDEVQSVACNADFSDAILEKYQS
jgi:YebC/PmpR family DNA-binding regulatory protein